MSLERLFVAIASALLAAHAGIAGAQLTQAEFSEITAACERGDGEACWFVGTLYRNGSGVAADPVRAADLFQKACDSNNEDGCSMLVQAYHEGVGVARDEARALSLLQRTVALKVTSCESGNGQKCLEAGFYYLLDEDGLERDVVKAQGLLLRGCDLQSESACLLAAEGVSRGVGAPADAEKAEELRAKGCALGDDTFRSLEPACRNERR